MKCGSKVLVTDKLITSQKLGAIFESTYNAQVESVNFDDADGVTNQINSWVSDLTNSRIRNFVNKADVVDTVVMLLNAVFFEGKFRNSFVQGKMFCVITKVKFKCTPFVRPRDILIENAMDQYKTAPLSQHFLMASFLPLSRSLEETIRKGTYRC